MPYHEDGYIGRSTGTVYQDGADWTEWGVFVGTFEECQNYIAWRQSPHHVQETIGGLRQVAAFSGTLDECEDYIAQVYFFGSYAIVPDDEYEVDYLN